MSDRFLSHTRDNMQLSKGEVSQEFQEREMNRKLDEKLAEL